MIKKVWITYAWKDNQDESIDFLIQELDKEPAIQIKLDKRNLIPGQRIWSQIGGIITDPKECDAWCIVLTKNSIESQGCIEELSYALDRTLNTREASFPVFALLHNINPNELPISLKIRLCILLEDKAWPTKVVDAVYNRASKFHPEGLEPWTIKEHLNKPNGYCLEIRPRFERIAPFTIAVDYAEKESGNVSSFSYGPANTIPLSGFFTFTESAGTFPNGDQFYCWTGNTEATSTTSYYLHYKKRPARVWFGSPKNPVLYQFN